MLQEASSSSDNLVFQNEIDEKNPFEEDNDKEMELEIRQPDWVKDEEVATCSKCGVEFTFTRRKHHCRACGNIYCSQCCKRWILLPKHFGYPSPVRNCNHCYKKHSSIDFNKNYEVRVSPHAPPIVLIHGSLFNRKFFHYQMNAWSDKFYVISIDLPGHGSRFEEELNIETCLNSVLETIERVIPSKPIIVGYSLGGYIAMLFAQKYPTYCRGLVLGGCCHAQSGSSAKFSFSAMNTLYSSLPNGVLLNLVSRAYPEIPKIVINEVIFRSGMHHEAFPYISEILVQPPGFFEAALASFPNPILFIHGEKDVRNSEESFLDSTKDGRLHVIRGASHLAPLDPKHRDEFNEVVMEFMQKLN